MSKKLQANRDVGLDILRMLSMLGIIMLHVIGAGGVLSACEGVGRAAYWSAFWVNTLAFVSVDAFGLLSGYLGISSKRASSYRLLELIAVMLFYCCLFTVIAALAFPDTLKGIKTVLTSLVPQIAGRYWYITCYIPIALLKPYINKALCALNEKQHLTLSVLLILVFGFLQSASGLDLFAFNNGYSFAWLLCLYIVGAYVKRVELFKDVKKLRLYCILLFFVASMLLLGGNIFIELVMHQKKAYLVGYLSPLSLLMALCLLLMFRNISIKKGSKALGVMAAVTFDIYLAHCHIWVYDHWIVNRFYRISTLPTVVIPAAITLCCIAIFAVCGAVGLLRQFLFRCCRLDVLLKKVAQKADLLLYNGFCA